MKRVPLLFVLAAVAACGNDGPTQPGEDSRLGAVRVSVELGVQEFPDTNGFLLTTAEGGSWVPGSGDTLVFDSLPAQEDFVATLSDLAHDCWVANDTRRVTVRPDTVVDIRFVVQCTTQWSYIRLITKTSGLPGPTNGHLMVRNGIASAIGRNDTVELLGPAGVVEQLAIQGASPGCWPSDTTTHAVPYPATGQTTTIIANVACGVILFHAYPLDSSAGLYQVNVVTSEIRALPIRLAEAYDFRLSPDGNSVVFAARVQQSSTSLDLWSVASDGSALTQLTQGPLDEILPVWDLDGQGVRFTDPTDRAIKHLDLGSGSTSMLPREGDWDWAVTPRPGTGELAYTRSLGNSAEIWLMSSAGTGRHPAFSVNYLLSYPDWSPDGSRLVAMGSATNPAERLRLYVGQPGSVPTPITDPGTGGADRRPQWSADGSSIAFIRILPGESERRLMLVDPTTLTTREIPIPAYWTGAYTWLR